ncbi:DUF6479 family protein [Streptomyces boncukensis]|uniref:Secreted protein n=1 Tax=Streptomyces boncukensis TaxID=2711219 RepID=A0A6G4WYX4_9ACTN|nr:DUF6479 family protein [Streptomyces boncukensis]NGO70203.1 hypothetical protein [Streptomyces boncukensis]
MLLSVQFMVIPLEVRQGIGPFVLGLAVVAALLGAVRLGIRMRARQPPPPRPDDQPTLPEGGPVREVREVREPDPMPRTDQEHRLLPHDIKDDGTTAARPDE